MQVKMLPGRLDSCHVCRGKVRLMQVEHASRYVKRLLPLQLGQTNPFSSVAHSLFQDVTSTGIVHDAPSIHSDSTVL